MTLPTGLSEIFDAQFIAELRSRAIVKSAAAGEVIVDIGQAVRYVPLVLSGTLKVSRMDENGRELLLYYVNALESCAVTFTCCVQEIRSEVRAVAEEDLEYLAIPVSVIDEWMVKYPAWKSYVMRTIRERFNELLRTVDQLAFQKLDDRLVSYLKEKAKASGSAVISLSHAQIASDLATSREVISRLLKKLENDNRVVLYRNQVKLLSDL